MNSRISRKSQKQIFLLVSGGHILCPSKGHQHGVSIQSFINLGKTFFRISRIWIIAHTWFLARLFLYVSSFIFQFLDFLYSWFATTWQRDHVASQNNIIFSSQRGRRLKGKGKGVLGTRETRTPFPFLFKRLPRRLNCFSKNLHENRV